MKKLITIFLTLFMLLSAAACQPTPVGGGGEEGYGTDD